jgi:hypothetical protein
VKGDIEIRLERGIEAARVGEYERARDILIQVIELDQYNERAWLWLSEVVETAADRFVCLENVLFINPDNARAAADLQDLRQRSIDDSALCATLPRLAVPQTLDEWRNDEWEWARKRERDGESKWEWDASATAASLAPAGKVCPRCGYRNPGWVYVCDRCGADLQPVDLREAISSGSRPRGRGSFTLLEAWGGTFTFNRLLAFQPEVELASWGRSLAALVMVAFFASIWRAIVTMVPELASGAGGSWGQIAITVLRCTAHTLPPALLLTVTCVPVALLTWVAARLVSGKQGFKIHAHLTAVAFSAWLLLAALLSPFLPFVPYLVDRANRLDSPFELGPTLVGGAVGLIGVSWLMQALRTAHRLSVGRTVLAALLTVTLSVALLFGLRLLVGEWLAELANMLAIPFLPWSG